MNVICLLIFQILLISSTIFALKSKEEILKMMCDGNSDLKDMIAMCIDEMDLDRYKDIMIECNPELGDDWSGKALMQYTCEREVEELEKADECALEMLKERGEEDADQQMMEDMKICMERKMSEENERK